MMKTVLVPRGGATERLRQLVREYVPKRARLAVQRLLRRPVAPPPGQVRFGDLRRTTPTASDFGFARGGPVDRYYIESFLNKPRARIGGRVLEVGDDTYTRR